MTPIRLLQFLSWCVILKTEKGKAKATYPQMFCDYFFKQSPLCGSDGDYFFPLPFWKRAIIPTINMQNWIKSVHVTYVFIGNPSLRKTGGIFSFSLRKKRASRLCLAFPCKVYHNSVCDTIRKFMIPTDSI